MRIVLAWVAALLLFFSCGKYEEGPGFSLRSKKARVSGSWKIEHVDVNGTDVTNSVLTNLGSDYTLHISSDNTYHEKGASIENTGTWKFGHSKEYLLMLSDLAGATEEHFEIIRLKNKELWLRETHEIHVTTIKYSAR